MARRSDHTRDELQALAINAGLEILEEKGLSSFSARQVALRIGYTIGTIYNVFGTHDNFLLHLNAQTLDLWYDHLAAAVASDTSRPVHALARGYIEFSRLHPRRWIALFEHHMQDDAPLPEWYMPRIHRFFLLLQDLLRPSLKGEEQVHHGAQVLWASIHGIAVLSATQKLDLVTEDSAEKLALAAVDTFLAGLAHVRL